MAHGTDVAGSGLLKVSGSSKLAFGATTAALVTLASTGTALLVEHATGTLATPTSLPPGALPVDASPVVVDHPVGEQPASDPTEKAIRDALAQRPEPGRRTLTVPLVRVVTPVQPVVEPSAPEVVPPTVTSPAVTPPVVTPPREEVPERPVVRADDHEGKALGHAKAHGKGHARGHDGTDRGKHLRSSHSKGRHAR